MKVLGALAFVLLAGSVEAQDAQSQCRIGRIAIRAVRVSQQCATIGAFLFTAHYYTAENRPISVRRCKLDPPTWGTQEAIEMNETGFRILVRDLLPGSEVYVSIAAEQEGQYYFLEKTYVY
jgi:hypothetical protein